MGTKQSLRKRGVVLTPQGQEKLNVARRRVELQDNAGKRLTLEQLCDRTQLSLKTITKVLNASNSVDKQTLEAVFYAFDLTLDSADYCYPSATAPGPVSLPSSVGQAQALTAAIATVSSASLSVITDWGEAPDAAGFYGRQRELAQLRNWIQADRCRLIGVLGMGGMGKTTLVTKLAQQLASSPSSTDSAFTHIIWRSLRNAPSRDTVLSDWLAVLSQQQDTQPNPARLLHHLKQQRCLLVLDNVETILHSGRAGDYRPGYEDYGDLLRLLGETPHQSCLVLTSREKILELIPLAGDNAPVRCLTLQGCSEAARQLVEARGLWGTAEEQQTLCNRYGSSPLAIKIIAATIRDLFEGDIATFLQQDALLFSGLRRLLDQQFERLSPLEQDIMIWLGINRDWMTLDELRRDLLLPVTPHQLLEAIESLHWRSLIEKQARAYTQQPVVMEYVTEHLTERVSAELLALRQPQSSPGSDLRPPPLLPSLQGYALLKTTAKDYIRTTQCRLILEPVCNLLQTALLSRRAVVAHLKAVLAQHQQAAGEALQPGDAVEPSYAAGNLLNLLCHLEADLTGVNVSGLAIWQAYLPNVPLPRTRFAYADLQRSQLTNTFGAVFAAVFSNSGDCFITGELGGWLRCWCVSDGQVLWTVKASGTRIHALAISPDGSTLAVGSGDRTIEFWDVTTGQHLSSLLGHQDQVYSLDFHPTTRQLASASCDGTIRLWDIDTGICTHILTDESDAGLAKQIYAVRFGLKGNNILVSGSNHRTISVWNLEANQIQQTLTGHVDNVFSLAIHPQGHLMASGSADGTVKLWHIDPNHPDCPVALLYTLTGPTAHVLSVRFSPDGAFLAGSSSDTTVYLWDSETGRLVNTLHHSHWIRAIAFSPDGQTLLSGSSDYTIRSWNVNTGHVLKTWSGYSNWIWSAAWSPDGAKVIGGCGDRTVRVWDADTGQCLHTLRGHSSWVLVAACSNDSSLIASGGGDNTVLLWHADSGKLLKSLMGHTSQVFCVQFSPTAPILASGSSDYSIRLWTLPSGEPLRELQGHRDWVRSIAFSHDGRWLASVGQDLALMLWDVHTGECLRTWREFESWVWGVAFHPDGDRIVTASSNRLALWNVHSGKLLNTYEGHTGRVRSVAISSNGRQLASGGQDNLVCLWDIETGTHSTVFSGHSDQVMSVAFSPDGRQLVSSSADETLIIWNLDTGRPTQILKPEGLYDGMDITGIRGLSDEAIATLVHLGAYRGER